MFISVLITFGYLLLSYVNPLVLWKIAIMIHEAGVFACKIKMAALSKFVVKLELEIHYALLHFSHLIDHEIQHGSSSFFPFAKLEIGLFHITPFPIPAFEILSILINYLLT